MQRIVLVLGVAFLILWIGADVVIRVVSSGRVYSKATVDAVQSARAAVVLGCSRTVRGGLGNLYYQRRIRAAADLYVSVNVARWLAKRGAVVACGGLLGEDNAAIFEKELAKYGIEDRFMRVPGLTRVNEMFVTPQGSFKVNRPAFPGVARTDLAAFVSGVATGDIVVLSGSLPQTWPADTYRLLVEAAKEAGAKAVLDASGKALAEGVRAHPDVIKPNAEECETLIGFVPRTPDDFKRATAAFRVDQFENRSIP